MEEKINVKALMVIAILSTSIVAMPTMSKADITPQKLPISPDGFGEAFSSFGMGGEMLTQIFEMLFMQTLAIDETQMIDGVYVLSANKTRFIENTEYDFSDENDEDEIHFLPYMGNGTEPNKYVEYPGEEEVFCKVEKQGAFDFNLTIGAMLTLVVYDNDGSFIEVVKRVIDFAVKMNEVGLTEALIGDLISLVSWIIIHINDIFTGDELFVFNPITYQILKTRPHSIAQGDAEDFSITKTWYNSTDDILGNGDDVDITATDSGRLDAWNATALAEKDSYMQWLLTDEMVSGIADKIFTSFSFDLIQLWIKNFHIEIDFSALQGVLTTGTFNIAQIFGGLDIEFYLFTHSLHGAFLYNDENNNELIDIDYAPVMNGTEQAVIDGTPVTRPNASELTHHLMLGNVDDFDFSKPAKINEKSIGWGVTLRDAEIIPVPMGVDLDSYAKTQPEDLKYIEFKLQFIKDVETLPNGTIIANGQVKLEHNFAPWNADGSGNTQGPNNNIAGLDLGIVYRSWIFHFHLNVDTTDESQAVLPDVGLNYANATKGVKIGNYIDDTADKDFIDIAGETYFVGNESNRVEQDANSQIVPDALWEFKGEAHGTHRGDEDTSDDDFSTDINLDISISHMYYGITYPDFDGSGHGIWHDPTFNIYMVFTPGSAGFWALILLIAAVGLAGVATIMIKKKKDREGF